MAVTFFSPLAAHSQYAYDKVGRLTDLTHKDGSGTNIADYGFGFDKANRLIDLTHASSVGSLSLNESVGYGYDARNQLKTATYTGSTSNETYNYDANGNRESVTTGGSTADYAPGQDNRLTSDGTYTFTYDKEGNRIAKFEDGQLVGQVGYGELSPGDTNITEYEWDHRNRLTQITQRDNYADAIDTAIIDYEYDVFDRRISKTVDSDGTGGQPAYRDLYVLDDTDIALEFHDPDADGPSPAVISHRYLHGPMVDMILADEQLLDSSGLPSPVSRLLWPLTDHLGSVRDIVDSGGDVQYHIQYDTFGREVARFNSSNQPLADAASVQFIFGFTGQERDVESGLYYYNARYYAVTEGVFISNDPSGFSAGDSNLQRYVENQATTLVDPSGLQGVARPAPTMRPPVRGGARDPYQGPYNPYIPGSYYPPSTPLPYYVPRVTRQGYLTGRGHTLNQIAQGISNRQNRAEYAAAMRRLDRLLREAKETARLHGVTPSEIDRCVQGSGGRINSIVMLREKAFETWVEALGRIPQRAIDTRIIIRITGNPPPGYKGGGPFENDGRDGGQILPRRGPFFKPITYQEYDVNPWVRGVNRGTERLVIGSDGRVWWTADHYDTFTCLP